MIVNKFLLDKSPAWRGTMTSAMTSRPWCGIKNFRMDPLSPGHVGKNRQVAA
jgi:hypothetical protein